MNDYDQWLIDNGHEYGEKECCWCNGEGCEKCDYLGYVPRTLDDYLDDLAAEGEARFERDRDADTNT